MRHPPGGGRVVGVVDRHRWLLLSGSSYTDVTSVCLT